MNSTKNLMQMAETFLQTNPQFANALASANSPEDYARGLQELLRTNPSSVAELQAMATAMLTMKRPNGATGLNPIIEAALAERISLDGDAPEMRSGPMPEDGVPAVPVITTSRNLIQVGLMLNRAAEEVQTAYRAAIAAQETALTKVALVTGIVGYEAGRLPAYRVVPEPSTNELARLTPAEERRLVWKVVSTTQGRRSVIGSLREGLSEAFPNLDFESTPAANAQQTQWVIQVFGAEDIDPNFQFIEATLAKFTAFLKPYRSPVAHIQPINGVASRTFGWTLHAWEKE